MNKTAIKNFAIWARNKLIADISYRAGLMGITADGIHAALPQSTGQTEFYDIGTAEPYVITGTAIRQRRHLAELIQRKEKDTDYKTAYKYIIEEVAYTWFNRLIAVRFMEVNDYLPSHIRVLSSESGKLEPDLVTMPFDADLEFTNAEQQTVLELKNANKLDEVFRLLFIKQCNTLNEILPALFEKTNDYSELLLNLSIIDQDGVVYHLVHDIPEEDFDVERGGQVEIIGWLYQYYNTEPKNEAFAKKGKITKEEVPAVTQLFTPDWIVRYMVENSLGRLWVEGHPNDDLKAGWKYYLEEAEQEPEVQAQLTEIRAEYAKLNPEDIKVIDPCMGSGHILVYAFDVLMQIYESAGYGQRDAARSILENNLYGLDIDDRAFQMAYFAVMMKARQYNRRILNSEYKPNVYSIQESNGINRNQLKYFGAGLNEFEKNNAMNQMTGLLDTFIDAKEYGSILTVEQYDWDLLNHFVTDIAVIGQMSFDAVGLDDTQHCLFNALNQGKVLSNKYEIYITNPPYMSNSSFSTKLSKYIQKNYSDGKYDLCCSFILNGLNRISRIGKLGMITQNAWMFQGSYKNLRKQLFKNEIINLIHLGARAFDEIAGEVVQTAAFVISKKIDHTYKAKYIRLTEALGEEGKSTAFFDNKNHFDASISAFIDLPDMQTAYWISNKILKLLSEENTVGKYGSALSGLSTSDNVKFLRVWFEVSLASIGFDYRNCAETTDCKYKWVPHNKGGSFRRWYGNRDYVVNWENNGAEIKYAVVNNPTDPNTKSWSRRIFNTDYFFKEGISWSDVATGKIACRFVPKGVIFNATGPTLFLKDKKDEMYFIAYFNSNVFQEFLKLVCPGLHYNTGPISKIPVHYRNEETINSLSKECINVAKEDWDSFETSWDFECHPLVKKGLNRNHRNVESVSIEECFGAWSDECDRRFEKLKSNEEELNRIFIDIYGLQDELTPEVEDKDITVRRADLQRDIRSLLSYALGCLFGRYSLDSTGLAFAGGEWEEEKYSQLKPDTDNIIPIFDEEYLEDDIVSCLCTFLKVAFGEGLLEENLDYIAKALGKKGDSSREIIRNYFLGEFFKDHCQTYSVTGSGKRPIYWLFDSGKQNGFKALIYLHRYNADTIGNLRIDYLHRIQRIYESEISRMQDMIDHGTNAREVGQATKRREKLTKQLKECREYDEKLAHLALSRIELDLDDGVKVNYRKLQTANDGKFYEVLADSKNIMAKK